MISLFDRNVFREHTESKYFAAHVVSVLEDELRVELVGLDEENTISVCEFLVTLGFAHEDPDAGSDQSQHQGNNNNNLLVDNNSMSGVVMTSKPPIPQRRRRPSMIEEEV